MTDLLSHNSVTAEAVTSSFAEATRSSRELGHPSPARGSGLLPLLL